MGLFIYKVLIFIIPVGFGAYVFFNVFLTHYRDRRKLNRWSEFNTKLISWAEEIEDPKVRGEYLMYATDFVYGGLNEALNSENKIKNYTETIYTRFGNHIPSLKQEMRNSKLKGLV